MTPNFSGQIDEPATVSCALNGDAKDKDLVTAAKNGNEQAFETLVRRHGQKVLAVARRYARVHEDAEDIVQLSLQKAFVHLHRFEERSSFSTWLVSIAMNESLMFLRHGRALREVPADESNDEESAPSHFDLPDFRPNPEASYSELEQGMVLSSAIQKLKPGMREVIELREFAELSTEETARRMGLTVSAVKTRLFHGRKKLRKLLTPCFGSRRAFVESGPSPYSAVPVSRDFQSSTASA